MSVDIDTDRYDYEYSLQQGTELSFNFNGTPGAPASNMD